MKVTDKPYAEGLDGTSQAGAAKGKAKASKTANAGAASALGETSSAKVKLSDRAKDIKKIKEAVNSQPDVDEAKIAKFKNLIASGKYNVDSAKVADKMVDEHAYGDLFKADTED